MQMSSSIHGKGWRGGAKHFLNNHQHRTMVSRERFGFLSWSNSDTDDNLKNKTLLCPRVHTGRLADTDQFLFIGRKGSVSDIRPLTLRKGCGVRLSESGITPGVG